VYIPWEEYGLLAEDELEFWENEFAEGVYPLLDAAREANRVVTYPLQAESSYSLWRNAVPNLDEMEANQFFNGQLLISVPLSIKNDLYGVLLAEEASEGRRFRARRLEIINGIAQQAALAIQNDRLQQEQVVRERLETEVQLARQIQQTFIPEILPQHPSWHLAARWVTARQVGGDFYDVINLPDGRLGLFIADVADKGMPAALFMALTRTLVRATVVELFSPADALRRVNELLLPDTQQGMFVTAVYAVLDMETGVMTYVNAGHNPPIWLSAGDGSAKKLVRTGVALGAMEQPNMREEVIQMKVGDSILLYTDGLSEAFTADGDMFGEERLVDAMRSGALTSADDLLKAVETSVYDFIGSHPLSDDLTMLGIYRLA
jgi:serine phosphatase RsbU (regulator of sigma subunit)